MSYVVFGVGLGGQDTFAAVVARSTVWVVGEPLFSMRSPSDRDGLHRLVPSGEGTMHYCGGY